MKKIIKEPARAKEEISMPNRLKMVVPKNKKLIIMTAAEPVAMEGLMFIPSRFILMMTGSEPMMSMTENKIKLTDTIAVKFIVFMF